MRYLALTISINGEIPNHREGLMEKIADYFIEKGYFFRLIHDRTTRPKGFYLFEARNGEQDKNLFDDFKAFLNGYKKEGVKYSLVELKDVSELLGD